MRTGGDRSAPGQEGNLPAGPVEHRRSGHRRGAKPRQIVTECPVDELWRCCRVTELGLSEGPESEHLHPAGEGVGQLGRTKEPGRSGEEEATRSPLAVDLRLDG